MRMTSFAEELTNIIERQTALMFTEEPVQTELLSPAPFGPVYECGGRGLVIFLSVSFFFCLFFF